MRGGRDAAPVPLEFISVNDTPEYKAVLTERRLRPLAQIDDETVQINRFRQLLTNL